MSYLEKIKKSKKLLKVYKKLFHLLSKLPKNKKLMVFESFNGRQYSDNPRALYEHLKKNYPEYRFVWSADKRFLKNFDKHDIEIATRFSLKWLWLMPRAKYWITNSRFPLWFPKSEGTVYLQTWHGTPLKRLGVDIEEVHMPDTTTEKYKENFVNEAKKWDYLISPNPYSTAIFKRAFGYDGTIIETGYPRNDYLSLHNNEEEKERIKEKLHVPKDKKIVLYAPTWRDDSYHEKGKYKFDLMLDLKEMMLALGEEYVVVLRLHYLIADQLNLNVFQGFAYDASHYEDIRELYVASDVLITDYSSVFFDYTLVNKPMIFYMYDLEEYRDNLRGFYFDIEQDAPGPIVTTTKEVIETLRQLPIIEETFAKKRLMFQQKFTALEDGRASERVVEYLSLTK